MARLFIYKNKKIKIFKHKVTYSIFSYHIIFNNQNYNSFFFYSYLFSPSMAIKVHCTVLSTAAIKVIACLNEKGLDYEIVPIDMRAGEHKKEPFLSLNPFGQVPAFEDGDLKLFESRAITQYIARTYADKGTPLIFHDPKQMAVASVWAEVEAQKFDPVASKLTWELCTKPFLGMVTDYAVVEEQEALLSKVLDVYEARLVQSKYLGGERFTLADLHHIPTLSYLMGTRVKASFDSQPHVGAWYADISARPAWEKIVAMTVSELKKSLLS